MQQVEHEHVRDQVNRCGGVAQAGNQLAQLRIGAEGECDVHLVDPAFPSVLDQLMQVAQHRQATSFAILIHLLRMRIVEAQQIEAHPRRQRNGAGQTLAHLAGADNRDPTRIEAMPTQRVQRQADQQPIAAQHRKNQCEPAQLSVIGQLHPVDQQVVQRLQRDEGHGPVTEDFGQLAQNALATP